MGMQSVFLRHDGLELLHRLLGLPGVSQSPAQRNVERHDAFVSPWPAILLDGSYPETDIRNPFGIGQALFLLAAGDASRLLREVGIPLACQYQKIGRASCRERVCPYV